MELLNQIAIGWIIIGILSAVIILIVLTEAN